MPPSRRDEDQNSSTARPEESVIPKRGGAFIFPGIPTINPAPRHKQIKIARQLRRSGPDPRNQGTKEPRKDRNGRTLPKPQPPVRNHPPRKIRNRQSPTSEANRIPAPHHLKSIRFAPPGFRTTCRKQAKIRIRGGILHDRIKEGHFAYRLHAFDRLPPHTDPVPKHATAEPPPRSIYIWLTISKLTIYHQNRRFEFQIQTNKPKTDENRKKIQFFSSFLYFSTIYADIKSHI